MNMETAQGLTSLILVSTEGHTVIVQALLDAGAKVNAKADTGMTSLMGAAWEGHTETVKVLLQAGAHADVSCDCARFVSSVVDITGMPGSAELLTKAGAQER